MRPIRDRTRLTGLPRQPRLRSGGASIGGKRGFRVGFMDRMKQAQDAVKMAGSPEMQQAQQQAAGGMGGAQQGLADRGAIEAQAHEFKRIGSIGQPAQALIKNIAQT